MKLYVVGVGPGDPELLTIKAKRIIAESKVIFYPTGGKETLALSIVDKALSLDNKRLVALPFPMKKDLYLANHYRELAERIYGELQIYRHGAFLILGDPAYYATFFYLQDHLKAYGVELEIIPGVSSFSAGSARLAIPLTQGNETMLLVTSDVLPHLPKELLHKVDCLVVLKTKKNMDILKRLCQEDFRDFYFFQRLYLQGEIISCNPEELDHIERDYFSFVILKRRGEPRAASVDG